MLTKQIERILSDFICQGGGDGGTIREYAEKIAALTDDNGATVAAAALENEVTSTLMDMLAATILATLIEEEGGGRANITYSPMSMEHMAQHYTYETENDGLIRTVRIKLREDSNLNDQAAWREPSNRHGLVAVEPAISGAGAKPQAEPKEHNRPVWAIRYADQEGTPHMAVMHDRGDATRHVGDYESPGAPLPEVQNRWCLHVECPTTGCLRDEKLRDPVTEVASEG
jgi:hypothetical protein